METLFCTSYLFVVLIPSFDHTLLCWEVQLGLLTPLTFAWHRLSPLGVFTSGVYFLYNGRQ